jgi:PAS domain S-box-containing protein
VNIWNKKTAELTGYSRDEAIGRPLVNFFINNNRINDLFLDTLNGSEVANYQGQFTSRNGDVIHLLINFTCRRDENGDITGGLAVSQDVTENAKRDR